MQRPLNANKPRKLCVAAKDSFVATAADSGTRLVVEEWLRRNGVKLTKVADFGNMEAVKRAVEAGLGVSVLSRGAIQREMSAGVLHMLPRRAGRCAGSSFLSIERRNTFLQQHTFSLSFSLGHRCQASASKDSVLGRGLKGRRRGFKPCVKTRRVIGQ